MPSRSPGTQSMAARFEWLAIIMDGLLRVPGTKFRSGRNPLIDFVPGIGTVSAAFVSTSLLIYAVTRGLPKILLARMALNILINELVGILPVVGSAFAFWFRARSEERRVGKEWRVGGRRYW